MEERMEKEKGKNNKKGMKIKEIVEDRKHLCF